MNITRYFKKIMRKTKYILIVAVLATKMTILAGTSNVSITPTAPGSASALTTILGYMEWLAIVGGIGVGGIVAAFKIMAEHDIEGGKRAFMYSAIGGVLIGVVSFVINSVI